MNQEQALFAMLFEHLYFWGRSDTSHFLQQQFVLLFSASANIIITTDFPTEIEFI
jgi:predicted Zn-dependent peptidase